MPWPRPIKVVIEPDHLEELRERRAGLLAEFRSIKAEYDEAVKEFDANEAELPVVKERHAELQGKLREVVNVLEDLETIPEAMPYYTASFVAAVQQLEEARADADYRHKSMIVPPQIPRPAEIDSIEEEMKPLKRRSKMWTSLKKVLDGHYDAWRTAQEPRDAIKAAKTAVRDEVKDLTRQLKEAKKELRDEENRIYNEVYDECERLNHLTMEAAQRRDYLVERLNTPAVDDLKMSVMSAEIKSLEEEIVRAERRGVTIFTKDWVEEYDNNGDLIERTSSKMRRELLNLKIPMKEVD